MRRSGPFTCGNAGCQTGKKTGHWNLAFLDNGFVHPSIGPSQEKPVVCVVCAERLVQKSQDYVAPAFIISRGPEQIPVQEILPNVALLPRELKKDGPLMRIGYDRSVERVRCDRAVATRGGEVIETGKRAALCASPGRAYTRSLPNANPLPDRDPVWIERGVIE